MLNRRALLSRGAAAVSVPTALAAASAAPAQAAPVAPGVPSAPGSGIPAPREFYVTADGPAERIRALQHLLTAVGHRTEADGIYGPATTASVIAVQNSRGLEADGLTGPLTAAALLSDERLLVREDLEHGPVLEAVRALIRSISGAAATTAEDHLAEVEVQWLQWFAASSGITPQGVLVGPVIWSFLFDPPQLEGGWSLADRSRDEAFRHLPIVDGRVALDQLTREQVDNGTLVIAVGQKHQIPAEGIQAALAAIMVECWMYNRYEVTDHDSSGMFQQRPSWSWGTYPQIRDKVLATEAFYGVGAHSPNPGVRQILATGRRSVGELAQAVQNSAFPHRYEERAADARAFYDRYAG